MVPRSSASAIARNTRRRGHPAFRIFPLRQDHGAGASAPGSARERRLSSVRFADTVTVDEEMAYPNNPASGSGTNPGKSFQLYLIVLLIAAAVYVGCMVSPPS